MAVYSMTGYASARQALPRHLHADAQDTGSPRRAALRQPASASKCARSTAVSSTSRCACPTSCARSNRRCASCSRRASSAARSSCASRAQRAADGACAAAARPISCNRLARLQGKVRELAAERARRSRVHEALQWCRGGAPQRSASTEAALEAGRALHRGPERGARAREGARLAAVLLERVEQLRGLAAQAEPLVPAPSKRSSSASSSAGRRRWTRPARRRRCRARRCRTAP